jgi:hypothetical protein
MSLNSYRDMTEKVESIIKCKLPEPASYRVREVTNTVEPHRKYRGPLPLANCRLSNMPPANPSQIQAPSFRNNPDHLRAVFPICRLPTTHPESSDPLRPDEQRRNLGTAGLILSFRAKPATNHLTISRQLRRVPTRPALIKHSIRPRVAFIGESLRFKKLCG